MKWEKLWLREKLRNGETRLRAAPVLSLHFYLRRGEEGLANAIAEACKKYIEFVGAKHLTQTRGRDYYVSLKAARMKRELKTFTDMGWGLLDWGGGAIEEPGEYGLYASVWSEKRSRATRTEFLRFDFPVSFGRGESVERVLELYTLLLDLLPYETSNAGYGFKKLDGHSPKGNLEAARKLMTYQAFDPGYSAVASSMAGCTYTAHWLNACSQGMVDALGGQAALLEKAPNVVKTLLPSGVLLRSAPEPLIGNLERGQRELGAMSEVARFLAPKRIQLSGLGCQYDAQTWLSRFD